MKRLQGMGTSPLVAYGKCVVIDKVRHEYHAESHNITNQEFSRFVMAVKRAETELGAYIEELKDKHSDNYQIFVAHKEMINDVLLKDQVRMYIDQGKSAEYAIASACDHFYRLLEKAEDEYLRQRKDDILDVKERLLGMLSRHEQQPEIEKDRVIVVSERIYPSDIMRMLKYNVLGLVSRYGSVYSHSAILARSLDIPYICQVEADFDVIASGSVLALDGRSGEVYVDPDTNVETAFTSLFNNQTDMLMQEAKQEKVSACTSKGAVVKVMGNCNHILDVDLVLRQDSDGIGLVRSEYLFADHESYPTEAEQIEIYRTFAKKMAPQPVVIRTFDFGADKPNRFLAVEKEENPALGYRGIRISLEDDELFDTQLRAIYRASIDRNLAIMFPMVTNLNQVRKIKERLERIKAGLKAENIDFDEDLEVGLMIETPAAALISDMLAREVDFFSIGTNDLIQYALAVDRTNARIAYLFETDHKAIKRLIKMTCENARKAKIRVGVCGEMAEDPEMIPRLISYGIQELSVSPMKINRIKKLICEL